MMVYNSVDGNEYAFGWLQDYAGPLYDPASNNRGANVNFWYNVAENGQYRYNWGGNDGTLAAFVATPGDSGGVYLTTAQANTILTNAGMPLTP
jgi:hypothetical protein